MNTTTTSGVTAAFANAIGSPTTASAHAVATSVEFTTKTRFSRLQRALRVGNHAEAYRTQNAPGTSVIPTASGPPVTDNAIATPYAPAEVIDSSVRWRATNALRSGQVRSSRSASAMRSPAYTA